MNNTLFEQFSGTYTQQGDCLAVGEVATCQRAQQGNHGDDDGIKAHACPSMFL